MKILDYYIDKIKLATEHDSPLVFDVDTLKEILTMLRKLKRLSK